MAAVAGQSDIPASAEPVLARPGPSWRLPVELLLHCLMASDTATRIRASHVCRSWRAVALAERRLWNSFSCFYFRNERHESVMFSVLQAFLLRSRPHPFNLKIPYSHWGGDSSYAKRILALEAFDIQRLVSYQGPAHIFRQLNPARAPLPSLVCLGIIDQFTSEFTAPIKMVDPLGTCSLPNLQELRVPHFGYFADGALFLSLRSVTLVYMREKPRALFAHCPHLVRLNILDTVMDTLLPDPPVPPSLEEVSIRCERPRALNVVTLMRHWHGVRVPRFTAREVYSLQGVLPLFLASHAHTIEIRLPGGKEDIVLAAIPDDNSVWTLVPSPPWAADFLGSIEKPTSTRLTSISVAFSRLTGLLRAQLHTPGLQHIELCLDSADEGTLHLETGGESILRAPQLRSVFFDLRGSCVTSLEEALDVLRTSFRSMLIYDAELLDTIIVSRQAEGVCAGFAPLAKDYAVNSGRSRPPIIQV